MNTVVAAAQYSNSGPAGVNATHAGGIGVCSVGHARQAMDARRVAGNALDTAAVDSQSKDAGHTVEALPVDTGLPIGGCSKNTTTVSTLAQYAPGEGALIGPAKDANTVHSVCNGG